MLLVFDKTLFVERSREEENNRKLREDLQTEVNTKQAAGAVLNRDQLRAFTATRTNGGAFHD